MSKEIVSAREQIYEDLAALKTGNQEHDRTIERAIDCIRKLRKADSEAAEHVEAVICMRTSFTGNPPYVGWKGLGLALSEALDERDALRELVNCAAPEGWVLLPRKFTPEMVRAYNDACVHKSGGPTAWLVRAGWNALIEAAPAWKRKEK